MQHKLPIVFSHRYDITMLGIQRLHPFDSEKYGKVFSYLCKEGLIQKGQHHIPQEVTRTQLLRVHTEKYLQFLKKSRIVAAIAEVGILRRLPNFLLQWRLLKPMRLATGGTLLGADLALKHGWAINLSGGYHHAKSNISSGFCFYSDIALATYQLRDAHPTMKVMVVDLDAHQGNGFEAIFAGEPNCITFDMYNGQIYPRDTEAQQYIQYNYPLPNGMADQAYLKLLRKKLPLALAQEQPDFIIYNAGTDILETDPLGALNISAEGIIARDHFVFSQARALGIPILMVLSGGYTAESSRIIARSIAGLFHKKLIGPETG
ncbi:MAG TPA: histone deacetylase [Bacteroidetes bacterium]|nr:histone deacetylase [Bacteroidota bacterium]